MHFNSRRYTLGQGANMAFEDAAELAAVLAPTSQARWGRAENAQNVLPTHDSWHRILILSPGHLYKYSGFLSGTRP